MFIRIVALQQNILFTIDDVLEHFFKQYSSAISTSSEQYLTPHKPYATIKEIKTPEECRPYPVCREVHVYIVSCATPDRAVI